MSIVDADPDLADVLEPPDAERARRDALVRVSRLSPGAWDAAAAIEPGIHHRGFLVIDGLLSREVDVLGRRCVELIGHGDVMRPWTWDEEGSHVHAEVGWVILEPARLAVLDHDLVKRLVPWPQIGLELFNRGTRRAHNLAVALAISHHQRVDDRHAHALAPGRALGQGAPRGHRRAAAAQPSAAGRFLGAHRPSVTTAMESLARAGSLSRSGDGHWVLHGALPAQLRHHRLAAVLS